jgi:predicted Zn-dependent protease with MMP-like domain
VDEAEFDDLVDQALEGIPGEFLEKLENIQILVEDRPSPEMIRDLGLRKGNDLFGLYQGTPRPDRSFFQGISQPDHIVLFRQPILRYCRTKREIKDQIRKTLVHEIAHYFGFSEQEIRKLGY